MPKEKLSVRVRMSREMIDALDLAIKIGAAMNRSDFIRAAVSEKLEKLSVLAEMKKKLRK